MRDTEPQSNPEQVSQVPSTEAGRELLEQITDLTKVARDGEGREELREAIGMLIDYLARQDHREERVDKATVDEMIAEYDRRLSLQMDLILHDTSFQQLESAWRGLWFLVDRTELRENIQIDLLPVSKEDLRADFASAAEIPESGLYKKVHSGEYGQHGGKPYGAVIANYALGPGAADVALLEKAAAVAAMSHAPFIAGAGPGFFNLETFDGLPNMNDLKATIDSSKKHTKWRGFRETEDARNVALVMPRMLLRLPYSAEDNPIHKGFIYNETVTGSNEHYLWGIPVWAMASRLTEAFAQAGWCSSIIGPEAGGTVHGLPVHVFSRDGREQAKIPTEVLISERKELELAEQGFVALTMRKGADDACFFSANSCQKPKEYADKDAELNYKLGTQLPYLFVINRIAHYTKLIQREKIGKGMSAKQLEVELQAWLRQWVLDQDVADDTMRAKRPLRRAHVEVSDIAGDPGWYQVKLKVTPHFKYMGAFFELSLVGHPFQEKDA